RRGASAITRADMRRAESCLVRALKIAQRDTPDSVILAKKFQSLGQFYRLTGDSERAQEYLERTAAIFEAAGSPDLAAPCLTILGDLMGGRGEAQKAEAYYRR